MVDIAERAYFQARAREMAPLHAQWLVADQPETTPERTLLQAVDLIKDCVQHVERPELAITLALHFQPFVERWSTWGLWSSALDYALAATQQTTAPLDEIRLLQSRSEAARESHDYDLATATAQHALELANSYHERGLVAVSLNKLGRIAYAREQLNVAHEYWERAYHTGQCNLSALDIGRITLNLGLIAIDQRRFEEAQHWLDLAQHHFEIDGDPVWQAKAQANLAILRYEQDDIAAAVEILLAAGAVFQVTGSRYAYAQNENALGCAFLRLGQWAAAHEHLQIAINEFEQLGSLGGKAWTIGNMIEFYVTAGQWEQAEALMAEGRELAKADKPLLGAAIDVDCGRALLARGNLEGARQMWEQALAVQQTRGSWEAAHKTQQLISSLPQ